MIESIAQRLSRGEKLIGTVVSLPSPEVAELLAQCGFDWLFIDMEHGPVDQLMAQRMLQAARVPCLLRLPDSRESTISRALHTGASGVILPGVNTVEEVERVVRACRYPPAGVRGVGAARAQGYGMTLRSYVQDVGEDVLVVPQIEHIDAVHDIEALANVSGVGALFIEPLELSASLGRPGLMNDSEVGVAIERVRDACAEAERKIGIFATDPAKARHYLEAGFSLVAIGIDALILGARARDLLQTLRG